MVLALNTWYGTGGGHRIAELLASLYNSGRVKARLGRDLGSIDRTAFEHVLNVFRLHFEQGPEIHTYFDEGGALYDPKLGLGGNAIFEKLITEYRLERCD